MTTMVVCPICEKEFKQLQYRHMRTHGLTMAEFREQWPDADILSKESSVRRGIACGSFFRENNPMKDPEIAKRQGDMRVGSKRPDIAGDNNHMRSPEKRKQFSENNPMKDPEIAAKSVRSKLDNGWVPFDGCQRDHKNRQRGDAHWARQPENYAKVCESLAKRRRKAHPFGTSIEQFVRGVLSALGISYEEQTKSFFTEHRFDFVLFDLCLVIETDGCYWHHCPECFPAMGGRTDFDIALDKLTADNGWTMLRIWEHDINECPEKVVRRLMQLVGMKGVKK